MKKNIPGIEFLALVILVLFTHLNCPKEDESVYRGEIWHFPTAIFTIYPATGTTAQLFEFDASGCSDPDDPDSLLSIRWDWEGDGIWDTPLSTTKYAIHQYSTAGDYKVTLKVVNTDSIEGSKKVNLIVSSTELPIVTTDPVSNITATSATCGGEVTDEGGASVTVRGVCWSFYQNPGIYDSHSEDGSGPGSFNSSLTNLYSDKTYFVRAFAMSTFGVAYGENETFRTDTVAVGGPCPGIPDVSWQGRTYNTVLIGDQCWLRENLNWKTGNSWCYDDDTSNCGKYGRLYDWETMMNGGLSSNLVPSGVQGICPDGWHIPSDEEWKILEGRADPVFPVGDEIWDELDWRGTFVGRKLKSKSGWFVNTGTNYFNFSANPGGYRLSNGNFYFNEYHAYFWSCTESFYNAYAYIRSLEYIEDRSNREHQAKEYGYSVRCLKD